MKLLSTGGWWLTSKKDPRWNCGGRCECGGFVRPPEVDNALVRLRKQYGDQPDDLEWGYMKD